MTANLIYSESGIHSMLFRFIRFHPYGSHWLAFPRAQPPNLAQVNEQALPRACRGNDPIIKP